MKKRFLIIGCLVVVVCLATLGTRRWIQAKELQSRTKMRMNMVSLYRAMSSYLQSHNEVFPVADGWEEAIAPYVFTPADANSKANVRELTRVPVMFWQPEKRIVMNRALSKKNYAAIDKIDAVVLFFESTTIDSQAKDLPDLKNTTATWKMAQVTFVSGWVLQHVSDDCTYDYCKTDVVIKNNLK